MSFDFFLANLLFGMTLLTASMAAAHFIGDFLVDRIRVSHRARMILRVMILLCCSLLSLLLFLVKLSGPELNKAFAPGAGTFEPRLSKKVKVRAVNTKNNPEVIPSEASWTFVDVLSAETSSELRQQSEILKRSGAWISLMNGQSPAECKGWQAKAQQFGLRVSESSSVPANADARVLVCVSERHNAQIWQGLRDLVSRGGSVFFVGRFVDSDTSTLSQLLQIKSWRTPEISQGSSFIFGGNLFSYGGFPSGLKVSLGKDWSQGSGQAIVGADGQNRLLSSEKGGDDNYTSFIAKSFAKGRVAWTSLPAHWSEKNKILYGEYWNLAVVRTFSFLARMPSIGTASYPADAKSLVIPVVHAEYDFKNARDIEAQLAKMKLPASYYIVMSEALNDRKTVSKISAQEMGASSFTHNSLDSADFFERVKQWNQWRRSLTSFDLVGALGERGALSLAGQDRPADTLAALMANRFSYVLGDPFNDFYSPRWFSLQKTEDVKEALKDRSFGQVKGAADEVLVLPLAVGDDFEFFQEGKMASANEIEQALLQKNKLSAWTGGPFVLVMHTQVLGTSQGLESLKAVLEVLKTQEAQFMDARSYINWWQGKSSLEMKLEKISEREMIIRMVNVGHIKATKVSVLNSEMEAWELSTDPADTRAHLVDDQVRLDELLPGESVSITLKKRSL